MQWIWDFYWKDLSLDDEGKTELEVDEKGRGREGSQICDLDLLREELRVEERELAGENASLPLLSESPVRDFDSIRREMMMVEEEMESSDEAVEEIEESSKMVSLDGEL